MPISDVRTSLRAAIPRRKSRASVSDIAAPVSRGLVCRMDAGRVWPIRSSSDSGPTTFSISLISPGGGARCANHRLRDFVHLHLVCPASSAPLRSDSWFSYPANLHRLNGHRMNRLVARQRAVVDLVDYLLAGNDLAEDGVLAIPAIDR